MTWRCPSIFGLGWELIAAMGRNLPAVRAVKVLSHHLLYLEDCWCRSSWITWHYTKRPTEASVPCVKHWGLVPSPWENFPGDSQLQVPVLGLAMFLTAFRPPYRRLRPLSWHFLSWTFWRTPLNYDAFRRCSLVICTSWDSLADAPSEPASAQGSRGGPLRQQRRWSWRTVSGKKRGQHRALSRMYHLIMAGYLLL